MPDVIVTHRLTKYYGAQCAVDRLNLRVAQGTVYGLLGRNGAGKRPPSRCCWAWPIPATAGPRCWAKTPPACGPKPGPGSPIWPRAIRSIAG